MKTNLSSNEAKRIALTAQGFNDLVRNGPTHPVIISKPCGTQIKIPF